MINKILILTIIAVILAVSNASSYRTKAEFD